ncbi:hydrogenase maturation protease [Desulfurispira natronophila]|uniref:Hydrogenase maturation protease n=1 Tax=Desulfurispira natronophila TaxID=682562 RepID=A0A7W7Y3Z7_9BACT|nr:hydrogenase maturation protease [Desulfurispira natronophila]MBB5021658.1 hydrogenase maturation protease [Desulfurispira natronophila]
MWLIIGYGNLLRGDDGLGCLLARRLASYLPPDRAHVIATHQLTPELALEMAEPHIHRVLFMDARRNQSSILTYDELSADPGVGSPGHQLQPSALLGITATLYDRADLRGWLLGLRGINFELGASPDALAQKVLLEAERFVDDITGFCCQRCMTGSPDKVHH